MACSRMRWVLVAMVLAFVAGNTFRPYDPEAEATASAMDHNKNGWVTREELEIWLHTEHAQSLGLERLEPKDVRDFYRDLDTNLDGYLTLEEVKESLTDRGMSDDEGEGEEEEEEEEEEPDGVEDELARIWGVNNL
eukprot:TRINITY_DN22418_c0_g1_i13.p1 TRINITY_DN22418_c0_g1~~TRINITY_DN22418_c0_g1_i13.p1  ORF type:complete len:136 (+),score=34.17 TRINITY_DN22418_c0_g1_i13:68-475(+)